MNFYSCVAYPCIKVRTKNRAFCKTHATEHDKNKVSERFEQRMSNARTAAAARKNSKPVPAPVSKNESVRWSGVGYESD